MPVGRDRAARVDAALAGEVREGATGLLDDQLHRGEVPVDDPDRVDGAVDCALGDQHVPPEVAVAACVPGAVGQLGQRLLEREGQHRVLDPVDRRDADLVAVDERAGAALGPPAAVQGRGATRRRAGRSRRPRARRASPRRGSPAGSCGCRRSGRGSSGGAPVPAAPSSSPRIASPGRSLAEDRPELRLDGAIGLGHGRRVGLRLDREVARAEAAERDRVGRVGEAKCELEVGAHAPDPTDLAAGDARRSVARP